MVSCLGKALLCFLLVTLISFSNAGLLANAQEDDFILEAEQRWETYGIGGTCIPGTHNLAVDDVDNDGINEIITGGFSYMMTNGSRASLEAPLKIWSFDGHNLFLEKSESWSGAIWVVYSADADGDGKTEIITSGNGINNTNYVPELKFWNWDGETLRLRGTYYDIAVSSMWVGNLNRDGLPELVTVQRPLNATESVAQLSIWNWDGETLTLQTSKSWGTGNDSRAISVAAADLNNDDKIEIVTAGYDYGLKNSSGQVRVWKWDEANLNLLSSSEWRMVENTYASDVAGNPMGNTLVNNVKIADLDGDNMPEILTGGFTYDGSKVNGQLRIWSWNGTINLEASEQWTSYDITELKSIAVNDADGDGKMDIITSGVTAGSGGFAQNATIKEYAQLKVWSWDGHALSLKQSKDWNVDEGVCAWQDGTGDLDNDGKIEIVTVGCSYKSTLCDPNLRIWSLPPLAIATSPSYTYIAIAIAAVATVIAFIILLFLKRKKE
jgi:hypothetical protein